MLLDRHHNLYGNVIPEDGSLGATPSAALYYEFEYTIPYNADPSLNTANIIFDGEGKVEIPAGTYDYCITNPTPDDKLYIAGTGGPDLTRADNFVFEGNKTYRFTMTKFDNNDG